MEPDYEKHTRWYADKKKICKISTKFVPFSQKETVNNYSLLYNRVL